MTSFRIRVPWLLLAPVTLLTMYADVTVRYQTEFQMNPALPASMTSAMTSNVPKDSILRFKDGKGYSASAGMDMITDFTTKEITLIDGAGKRYAKMTSEQYGQEFERAMPVIPPQARTAAASMKTESTPARMTGRTAVIQGVEAEEREFAISTQMPGPPNSQPGPTMKIVLQIWKAKPNEIMRAPAMRELAGYSYWSHATMNPAVVVSRMMKQVPFLSDMLETFIKELSNGPTLRMHMAISMPGMATLLRAGGGNSPGAGLSDDEPLMQMDQVIAELSTATVAEDIFRIPQGYQEAAGAELIKGMIARGQAAAMKQ